MQSTSRDTEALIGELGGALGNARPLRPASVRASLWLTMSVLLVVVGAVLLNARLGVFLQLQGPEFFLSTMVIATIALAAGWSAFLLSVPGHSRGVLSGAVALVAGCTWVGSQLVGAWSIAATSNAPLAVPPGEACAWTIMILAIAPCVAALALLRRAAPTSPAICGAAAFTAAVSLGALAVQFCCPSLAPAHLLFWHVGPVFALGLFGSAVGRALLKW